MTREEVIIDIRDNMKPIMIDCISRQAVLDLIADYDLSMGQVVKGIHALPSVTPTSTKLDTIKQILEDSDLDAEGTLEVIKEVVEE